MNNFMINSFNFIALDIVYWVTGDFDIFIFPLFSLLIPVKLKNDYRLYNSYFFDLNMTRKFSVYYTKLYNSNISNKILKKDLKKTTGTGYYAYNNIYSLGYLIELIDNKNFFVNNLSKYLETLEDQKTYSVLPVIR